jgi:hypothetical protein
VRTEAEYAEVVEALERAPSIIVPMVREVPEPLRKRRRRWVASSGNG